MFCPQIFGKNTKKDKNAIGNIISQPFKDLWPRTIRQAIYFIDFHKIIMRNFGMAIVIPKSSKCQKLCIRNTHILHTIDYISASPTDTDAQYLYIFRITFHLVPSIIIKSIQRIPYCILHLFVYILSCPTTHNN